MNDHENYYDDGDFNWGHEEDVDDEEDEDDVPRETLLHLNDDGRCSQP